MLAFRMVTAKTPKVLRDSKNWSLHGIFAVVFAVCEEPGVRLKEARGRDKTIKFTKDIVLGMHNNGARGIRNGYAGRATIYNDIIPALKNNPNTKAKKYGNQNWDNKRIEAAITGLIKFFDARVV